MQMGHVVGGNFNIHLRIDNWLFFTFHSRYQWDSRRALSMAGYENVRVGYSIHTSNET